MLVEALKEKFAQLRGRTHQCHESIAFVVRLAAAGLAVGGGAGDAHARVKVHGVFLMLVCFCV